MRYVDVGGFVNTLYNFCPHIQSDAVCYILQWSSPGQDPILAVATSKHATISVVFFREDVRKFILKCQDLSVYIK